MKEPTRRPDKSVIVKVQTPLNRRDFLILVYDKEKSHITNQLIAQHHWLMVQEHKKLYFTAIWNAEYRCWVLHDRVQQSIGW